MRESADKLWLAGERQIAVARDSVDAALISAEAASRSADAAVAVERARFFIVIDKHNLTEIVKLVEISKAIENGSIPGGDNICITYRFKNYRKTPGIVRELIVDSMIVPDPIDPPALFLSRIYDRGKRLDEGC